MDIKAMAKSKRSHTKHNQPRKPKTHSSSSSSATNTSTPTNPSDPKASKKQGDKKRVTQQPPSLPSNWDRYEDEEYEEGGEREVSIESGSKAKAKAKPGSGYDVVKPKSKGADLRELIAQAKESKSSYSSNTPSFDDALPDLYQGLGPMLDVRGENVLSWNGLDDFLADDEATTTQEVPFLSLDLQALAEELAKVDLATRLFIEPDLLHPELRAPAPDANVAGNQVPFHKPERQNKAAVAETFDELLSLYLDAEEEAKSQNHEDKDGVASSADVIISCNAEPASVADVTKNKSDDLGYLDPRKETLVNRVAEKDSGPSSGFEAVAVEAELDMLLGSLSETKLSDSPSTRSEIDTSRKQLGNSDTHVGPSQHSLGPTMPAFPVNSSLDHDLDDLLEETSKPNNKDPLFQSIEVKGASFDFPSSSSSTSHPTSKSNTLEDFDSWLDTL